MQHSAQNGSVKREDRVPLAALVELRGVDVHSSEQADELVEADGLNVSIGGIAMRTAQAPRLGQLITCRFSCPPTGELVRAQGQVVWSEQLTPERGAFGLRFVELDTKSATALRRLVSPGTAPETRVDRPRTALLSIDGLGTTIDAGLKLADDSRVVLEQRLTFLQLGRSVEVTVPGRGKERGRIASVELRQSQFDVPTLVYGVLLDGAPGRLVDAADAGAVALFATAVTNVSAAELAESGDPDGSIDESALLAAALESALVPGVDARGSDSGFETVAYAASFGLHDEVEQLSDVPSDVRDEELSHEPSSYYYARVVAPAVRDKTQRERSSRIPPAEEEASDLTDSDTHPGIGPAPSPFAPAALRGSATQLDVPAPAPVVAVPSASGSTAQSASTSSTPSASASASSAPLASASSAPTSSAPSAPTSLSASSSVRTLQARYSLPPPAAASALERPVRDTRQELAEAALAYGELGANLDERAEFREDLDAPLARPRARFDADLDRDADVPARAHEDSAHDEDYDAEDEHDAYPAGAVDDDAPIELQPSPAELPALQLRTMPAHLRSLFRVPVAKIHSLRQRFEPSLRAQTEFLDLPEARSRLLLHLARGRALVLRSWSGLRKSTSEVRARKTRPLRMQRSSLLGPAPAEGEAPRPPQTARIAALALALVGIGLGVYALAPRSGADRIRIPERLEPETAVAEPTIELHDQGDPLDEPVVTPAPKPRSAKRGKQRAAAEAADPALADDTAAAPPAASVLSAPFGEAEVPNGRVFTLRMNGPVELVEGEARPNGITVRVPGRLALDRASPIATSHSAVSRAMILNRGGYAELTIDFQPGVSPRYQVRGRDNTLEVTLERL